MCERQRTSEFRDSNRRSIRPCGSLAKNQEAPILDSRRRNSLLSAGVAGLEGGYELEANRSRTSDWTDDRNDVWSPCVHTTSDIPAIKFWIGDCISGRSVSISTTADVVRVHAEAIQSRRCRLWPLDRTATPGIDRGADEESLLPVWPVHEYCVTARNSGVHKTMD